MKARIILEALATAATAGAGAILDKVTGRDPGARAAITDTEAENALTREADDRTRRAPARTRRP